MVNEVSVESDQWDGVASERTPVCCWGGEVIYVDSAAPGYVQNGTCWAYAYRDLQMALARAARGCGSVIWMAEGVYGPGGSSGDTFKIPEGVSVYGGYAGYGAADPDLRDWKKYKTILSGYIDEATRSNTVVTMGNNSLLNGLTIEEGADYAIYGSEIDYAINNCFIRDNYERGIYCKNGNLTIQWSEIYSNGRQGVYHEGSKYSLTVENCRIYDNKRDGVLTDASNAVILNSMIYQNGLEISPSAYYGINLLNPFSNPTIRNCTIAYNVNEGIRYTGAIQNHPNVRSSILFANNADDNYIDLSGCKEPWHCCLTDPNNLDQPIPDPPRDARGNIRTNPGFAYLYPVYGYFHLAADSPCINKGEPNVIGPDEVDIDGDDRDGDGLVDIGADEVVCDDTSHPIDWNGDGVINYEEYNIFSAAWLSCEPNFPGDPNNWNPLCNLDQYGNSAHKIDLADLIAFCEDDSQVWLWEACWRENYTLVWGLRDGENESMAMKTGLGGSLAIDSNFAIPEEKSIIQQILDLEAAIKFLEQIWLEEPEIQEVIKAEDWQDFMDTVYSNLYELQTQDVHTDLQR